ncbi:hypothetical protein [Sphingomonas adhaesiva]|uniref:hypothetical protein n=1 Tax=Sphingomonas adhaesiva TaxID=28212 RepID=UPI002FF77B4E
MPFHRSYYAVLLLAPLVLVAFWPGYFAIPREVVVGVHAHAITAILWLVLLATQMWAIRTRRGHLHRALGLALFAVVPAFVAGGALAIQAMMVKALAGHPFYARFGPGLAWADILATPCFLALVAYALARRREVHAHGGAMLATAVLILPPALGRVLPLILSGIPALAGFAPAFYLAEAVALLLAVGAARADRRQAWPFALVAVSCAVQIAGFAVLAPSPAATRLFAAVAGVPAAPLALTAAMIAAAVLWWAWRAGGGVRRRAPAVAYS